MMTAHGKSQSAILGDMQSASCHSGENETCVAGNPFYRAACSLLLFPEGVSSGVRNPNPGAGEGGGGKGVLTDYLGIRTAREYISHSDEGALSSIYQFPSVPNRD